MRKKILVALIAVMALVSMFTLTSCNKPEETPNPRAVIKNFIKAEEYESQRDNALLDKAYDVVRFNINSIYDKQYARMGLLVTKSERSDCIGFYSLHYQKYIIEEQFFKDWIKYKVIETPNIGYVLIFFYQGTIYAFDSFGNNIYSIEGTVSDYYNTSVQSIVKNGVAYIQCVNSKGEHNYYYSTNLTLEYTSSLPTPDTEEPSQPNPQNPYIPYDPGQFNDRFIGTYAQDLTKVGAPGYYLSYDGVNYVLFNSSKQEVSTFRIEDNAGAFSLFGGKIFYQVAYELPEDASNYTYYNNNKKYELITYAIDLLSGTKSALNLNYVINNIYPVETVGSGVAEYARATVSTIENRYLKDTRQIIIDSNGSEFLDVTGMQLSNIVKLGDNYFNFDSNTLYDSSLNLLSKFDGMVDIDTNNKLIISQKFDYNTGISKYGVVNFDGIIKVPFSYESINPYIKNGYIMALSNGYYSRYNIDMGLVDSYSYMEHISRNIYLDKYSSQFIDLDGKIMNELNVSGFKKVNGYENEYFTNDAIYAFAEVETIGDDIYYATFSKNEFSNTANFTPMGSERLNNNFGQDKEHAFELLTSINRLTFVEGRPTYLKLDAEADKLYTLKISESIPYKVYSLNNGMKEYVGLKTVNNKQYFSTDVSKTLYVEINIPTFTCGEVALIVNDSTIINSVTYRGSDIFDSNNEKTYIYTNNSAHYNSTTIDIIDKTNIKAYYIINGIIKEITSSKVNIELYAYDSVILIFDRVDENYDASVSFNFNTIVTRNYTIQSNNSANPFLISGNNFESTNHIDGSTSILEITINQSGTMTFNYTISSEQGYDEMIIMRNSNTIKTDSGEVSSSYSGQVYAGDTITIKYKKDNLGQIGQDKVIISEFYVI